MYDRFAGGFDKNGVAYISKLAYSPRLRVRQLNILVTSADTSKQTATYQLLSPSGAQGQPMTTGFTFEYDVESYGLIHTYTMDVANPKEYTFASRIILTTQAGAIQQWKQDQHSWTREESLTEVAAVLMVDLPEAIVSSSVLEDKEENAIQRIQRQIGDLQVSSGSFSLPLAPHLTFTIFIGFASILIPLHPPFHHWKLRSNRPLQIGYWQQSFQGHSWIQKDFNAGN